MLYHRQESDKSAHGAAATPISGGHMVGMCSEHGVFEAVFPGLQRPVAGRRATRPAVPALLLAATGWVLAMGACSDEASSDKGSGGDATIAGDAADAALPGGDGGQQDAASDGAASGSDTHAADAGPVDAGPLTPQFTFAVIADSHVTGKTTNLKRLQKAIAWINDEASKRQIELVLVLGDIGWGKDGLTVSRQALDLLTMPYVPVIGDNEIHGGAEHNFDEVFGPVYAGLSKQLDDVVHPPSAVTNTTTGKSMWLQNVAFSYKGVRFFGLDISPRSEGMITGEQGELHEQPGGTWPWLTTQLAGLGKRAGESVILFSHIPMHLSPGGLSDVEMEKVYALFGPIADTVYAQFGGHYHFEMTDKNPKAGYIAYVTDATWDDQLRVRLVTVSSNAAGFAYAHELIDVPWP